MKKKYLCIILLITTSLSSFGQMIGDFQSKGVGPSEWNNYLSWQIYNGSIWIDALASDGYPGENITTSPYPAVTILSTDTINISSSLFISNELKELQVFGTLSFGDGLTTQKNITLTTSLITIESGGILNFNGQKIKFTLTKASAVLIIEPSGQITGSCTNKQEIYIGTRKFASCKGAGPNTYTFGEVIDLLGNINAKITNPATDPISVSGCTQIDLEGGYNGTETTVSYTWTVRNPNGITTTISSGNLDDVNVTTSTSFTPTLIGEYLVSLEVTTTSLSTNVETRTFNVIDPNPTITAAANTTGTTDSGCTSTTVILGTPITNDSCSVLTVTNDAPTTFPLGNTTVTWTVTDGSNNSATATQLVTVTDNVIPTISTVPVYVNTNTDCTATGVVLTSPTTGDNCSVASVTNDHPSTTFPLGNTTVTWTVTDGSNNSATATQLVTVTDNVNPTISTVPVSVNTNTDCTATGVVLTSPAAADNCSVASVTNDHPSATFPLGNTTVTWTVTDGSNNSTTATQLVTVTDNVKPTISTVPISVNTNINCPATGVVLTSPTTADNCSVASVTNDYPSTTFPLGNTTVTWTVTDGSNNSTTATQLVTVTDNVNPTISTVPVFVNTNTDCTATGVVLTSPTTSDNCSVASVANDHPSTTFPLGNTTVTWTVTDGSNNSTMATQLVTVTDNVNPTISTVPVFVNTNTDCTATGVVLTSPTTWDNCSVASVTNDHPSTTFPLGNTTVTWTVIDGSNNSTMATQIVTVTDNVNPTISCSGDKTASTSDNGTGDCSTTVNLGIPTTNDNCGIASIIAEIAGTTINPTTHIFPIGKTTVTWLVTDNNGLAASCDQIVTIVDDESPYISCPADQNVSYNTTCQYALQDYRSFITTSDNCDSDLTITQSPVPGTLISAATTTVTITAKDDANKTSSCTFKVIAIDNTLPKAVCKDYTVFLSPNGTVNIAALNLDNGSSDNCGIAAMTVSPNSFNCSNVGANNVIFTVFDNGGNSASCTAIVTVIDNTAPTMLCNNYVVVVDPITRVATIKASNIDNGSNDACGIASLSVSPSVFSEAPNVYNTTTTLTAIDVNGNSNSCIATVTVEPPKNLFTYLTGIVVNPIPDNPQPPSALVEVTACPGGVTVPKDIAFTLEAIGDYDLRAEDVLNWEYSNDNGETWIVIPNTAGLLTYTLIGLTGDTFVRLRIRDADVFSLIKTSAEAYARFLPPDEPPIIVSNTALDICLHDSVTVNAESFYDQPAGQFGKGGEFNYAQPDGWRVDGEDGEFPASGDNSSELTWKETNSNNNATFSGINYDTTDNTKFALAHGVANSTSLETPVFSTIGMTSSEAILSFNTSYYFCNGGYGEIWLSFDSGNSYAVQLSTNELYDFDSRDGLTTSGVKLAKGPGNKCIGRTDPRMLTATVSLGDYTGLSGLRVKFVFNGSTSSCGTVNGSNIPNPDNVSCNAGNSLASGWAIDDVGFAYAQVDDELEWTDEDGTVIATGTTATVTPVTPGIREYGVTTLVNGCRTYNSSGTNYVNINTSLAYAGEDYLPLSSNCGESILRLNAYDNRITSVANYNKGAWINNLYVVPNIQAGDTDYEGTGITGNWSIVTSSSTSCGNAATFSSATDPNAIFTADPGSYKLRWTLTNGCYDELNVTLIDCKTVDFDGVNDYVTFKNNYNLNSDFSIEVWVKPNAIDGTKTVFSRKDAADSSKGYDLSIVNGQVQFNWNNSSGFGTVTSSTHTIDIDRWYHLAVTFNGTSYTLYVDGLELGSVNGTAPALTTDSTEALLGAMYQESPKNPTNYLHGWIDELKIWNKALSVEHIRQMMNQEIDVLGSDVGGVVIPLKIYGSDVDNNGIEDDPLLWSNLLGYYRMNLACGNLDAFKGVSGRLHNIVSTEQQTAPIPYTTRISNQTWDTDNTWTHFSVWDVPNSTGINGEPIDWNIVKTNHKVTSNLQDLTLLGLLVQSNEVTITGPGIQNETNFGHGLWITHYLKLDGFINLVGESQLVEKRYETTQFCESILATTSTGFIKRDQQGKKNSFNYNYWSSPVSTIQGLDNNTPYTISSILKDGTDSANPQAINFGGGAFFADGPVTIPIKISNRWIWSYSSLTPDSNTELENYNLWNYLGGGALLKVGEGFTMKGTGGTAEIDLLQNYSFIGKPNSGTIIRTISEGQTYLVGNPYPSALDAHEFILDNLADRAVVNVINGALYFWDHFGISDNHNLAEYQGGYASYTLTGGVPAVNDSPLTLNDGTIGSKIPERYIPVGQGFFVDAELDPALSAGMTIVSGGPINFKNSQRAFIREAPENSLFMKPSKTKKAKTIETIETTDSRSKIRLGFDSTTGAHRQLLLGADSKATNQFDIGYDAPMFDIKDNDMYWELSGTPFVIQAVPNFNDDQIIPLGLNIAKEGDATIKIDALENISKNIEIYLHDNETGIYHDIKNNTFSISLPIGEYKNRFSLQFVNKLYGSDKTSLDEGILAYYTNDNEILNIKNNFIDALVEKVTLFNILGQSIANWDILDIKQNNIQIPIKNMPAGVYIIKIKTTKGDFSKKVIIP